MGDFGISRVLQFTQDMAQTAVGTPLYVAPEVVKGLSYDSKADVWSMGCTFYEIYCLESIRSDRKGETRPVYETGIIS